MFTRLTRECAEWTSGFLGVLPGGIGRRLRAIWNRLNLKSLGKAPCFETDVTISGGKNISIGDRFFMMHGGNLASIDGKIQLGNDVSCNLNVLISSANGGEILIGNNVLIGPNTVLRACNHAFSDKDRPIQYQGHIKGRIIVEDDVWIGANVVILPDVTIRAHSVVAAGAVVTDNVEPWSVVGGVPARVLSRR
jgi:galactoside O-acetyltransferase